MFKLLLLLDGHENKLEEKNKIRPTR
jgi:hypothetical protein